jgi:hypothetical protein
MSRPPGRRMNPAMNPHSLVAAAEWLASDRLPPASPARRPGRIAAAFSVAHDDSTRIVTRTANGSDPGVRSPWESSVELAVR